MEIFSDPKARLWMQLSSHINLVIQYLQKIRIPSISPPFGSICRVGWLIWCKVIFDRKRAWIRRFPCMKNCLSLFFLIFLACQMCPCAFHQHASWCKQTCTSCYYRKIFSFHRFRPYSCIGYSERIFMCLKIMRYCPLGF